MRDADSERGFVTKMKVNAGGLSGHAGIAEPGTLHDFLSSLHGAGVEMIVEHGCFDARVDHPHVVSSVRSLRRGEDIAVFDGVLRKLDAVRGVVGSVVEARSLPPEVLMDFLGP